MSASKVVLYLIYIILLFLRRNPRAGVCARRRDAGGGFTKVERGLCNCYETPSRWRRRQRFKQVYKKKKKKGEEKTFIYSFRRRIFFFSHPVLLPRGVIFLIIILGPPSPRACNDLQIIFKGVCVCVHYFTLLLFFSLLRVVQRRAAVEISMFILVRIPPARAISPRSQPARNPIAGAEHGERRHGFSPFFSLPPCLQARLKRSNTPWQT